MNNEKGHNNTISTTVTQNWFLIGKNMCNATRTKLSPSIFYEF